MVLDSGRTLIIWIVSLALLWQKFYPLQVVGFVLLILGMGLYYGVWEHLIHRFISRPPISSERSQLLPGHNDVSINQQLMHLRQSQIQLLMLFKHKSFSLACISIVKFLSLACFSFSIAH